MPNSIGGKSSGSKKRKAPRPLPIVSVSSSLAKRSKGGSRGSGSRASRASRGNKKKYKNNPTKTTSDGKKGEVPNQSNETIKSATPSTNISTRSSTPSAASAPRSKSVQLVPNKNFLTEDRKGKGKYELGIYKLAPGATQDILATLQKFFMWPPRTNIFVTSGYYPDISKRGGATAVPSNEIWVMNLDPDDADDEPEEKMKKLFPGSTGILIEFGENGLRMAKVKFAQKAGRDKAWGKSTLRKLGPGKLDWLQPNEIKIENLSPDITEASLKERYPHSKGISFREDQRQAVIQFASPAKAEQEYKTLKSRKDYVDLGGRSVAMMNENENFVLKVPFTVRDDDVVEQVPNATDVQWLESGDGNRVAVVSHGNPSVREKSHKVSPLPKQGPQLLGWQAPKKGKGKGKVGAAPNSPPYTEAHPSKQNDDGSGVPSNEIWIMNLDPDDTYAVCEEKLRRMFPGSAGISIETGKNGLRMAKEIKIENLSPDITEATLRERYPHSTGIVFRKGQRQAIIQFASPAKAEQEYKTLKSRKDYVDLGGRSVAMMNENENYILKVPHHVGKEDVAAQIPDSKEVHWLESGDGNRVAVVSYGNPSVRENSHKTSPLPKDGQQLLRWPFLKKGTGKGMVMGAASPARAPATSSHPPKPNDGKKKVGPAPTSAPAPAKKAPAPAPPKPKPQPSKQNDGNNSPGASGVPSNEIWIMNLDPDDTDAALEEKLKKMFPGSTGISIEIGENGLRMAKEIKIENLSPDITEATLKELYPHSTGIVFRKGQRQAIIQFASPAKAEQEYKTLKSRKDYVDLGGRSVVMMNENENYVLKVPHHIGKGLVADHVPDADDVRWLESGDGNRVAVVSHGNTSLRERSHMTSPLPKQGQQLLGWQSPGEVKGKGKVGPAPAPAPAKKSPLPSPSKENQGNKSSMDIVDQVSGAAEMTDAELAASLWKVPDVAFSNLSSLFKPTLYIINCPKSMRRTAMLKLFQGCSKVDIKNGYGIIEFDTPLKAAHAFHVAEKAEYEGRKLKISVEEPKGLKGGGGKKRDSVSSKKSNQSSMNSTKKN